MKKSRGVKLTLENYNQNSIAQPILTRYPFGIMMWVNFFLVLDQFMPVL